MFFCLTLSLFSSSFLLYVIIIICPTSTYSKNIILVINAFRLVFPFPHHPLPTILPVLFPVNLPFPYFLSHLPYHDISLNGNAFVIGTIILLYVVVEKIKMTDWISRFTFLKDLLFIINLFTSLDLYIILFFNVMLFIYL